MLPWQLQRSDPTFDTRTSSSSLENSKYEVVVGSLGTVYSGNSCMRASMAFIDCSADRISDTFWMLVESGFCGSIADKSYSHFSISGIFLRCARALRLVENTFSA
jgi:hypothetical protein